MILHIDQQRFDELTEWCRNKPEEAAHRILHAEAEGGPKAPESATMMPVVHNGDVYAKKVKVSRGREYVVGAVTENAAGILPQACAHENAKVVFRGRTFTVSPDYTENLGGQLAFRLTETPTE